MDAASSANNAEETKEPVGQTQIFNPEECKQEQFDGEKDFGDMMARRSSQLITSSIAERLSAEESELVDPDKDGINLVNLASNDIIDAEGSRVLDKTAPEKIG